jgi:hypothetical protein
MTNIELITKALLKLGIINESETPSAEQATDALDELNQMLEEWEESSINLGWSEQTSTSATAPLPPYAESGVILQLALALSPSYGGAASVTPALIKQADESMRMIERKAAIKVISEADSRNLPVAEGQYRTNRILTDG